jgi:hypothetical protein
MECICLGTRATLTNKDLLSLTRLRTKPLFMSSQDYHVSSLSESILLKEILKTGIIKGNLRDMQVAHNCWVCQGWAQVEFKLLRLQVEQAILTNDPEAGVLQIEQNSINVNLHTSFDHFKPHKMKFEPDPEAEPDTPGNGSYVLARMVPPGHVTYFYSIGNFQKNESEEELALDLKDVLTLTDGTRPIIFN